MLDDELPPNGGPVDQSTQLLILFWATAAVSVMVVGLRFLGRHFRRQVGLDDWVMLVALILHVLFVSILTKAISVGALRHTYNHPGEDAAERARILKWTYIGQPFIVLGFATGKLSIGILLWRVVGSATCWRKWLLCFVVALALALSVANVVLMYVQCSRVEALWNWDLVAGHGRERCWDPRIVVYFSLIVSGWNIVVDVFLAVLPATFLYKLNLTVRKKIGLYALLSLGSLAGICAAVKTKYMYGLTTRSDITRKTYDLYVWSVMELFLIIICGSIAPVKPVYDRLWGPTASSSADADSDAGTGADATGYTL
ncbi:hypothetical protein E4U21_000557 [Claviceps maximensis]|nr:hypothetical protein E4U21_000557 [Claviceps maximensis]